MKYNIAVTGITIVFSVVSATGRAAPVLILNEPSDIKMAQYSCDWAESKVKSDDHLIKAVKCDESELCRRASRINAACKASRAVAEVRAFHRKLLTEFASHPRCAIEIMSLTDDKSDKAVKENLEALKRANLELNLSFVPGATKQTWALWPHESGIVSGDALEGEGDFAQIARDVCTIMTRCWLSYSLDQIAVPASHRGKGYSRRSWGRSSIGGRPFLFCRGAPR
jgi:hypothetical protein